MVIVKKSGQLEEFDSTKLIKSINNHGTAIYDDNYYFKVVR